METITKENLLVGDLLVNHGGATMRWNNLLQVTQVTGNKVYFTTPLASSNGNQEGDNWITGLAVSNVVTHKAKFHNGRLVYCGKMSDNGFKAHYWSFLHRTTIGEKHCYYGD